MHATPRWRSELNTPPPPSACVRQVVVPHKTGEGAITPGRVELHDHRLIATCSHTFTRKNSSYCTFREKKMAHSVSLVSLNEKVIKQLYCSRSTVTPSMAITPLIDLYWSVDMDWSKMLPLSTGRESVQLRRLVAAYTLNRLLQISFSYLN